MVPHVMVPRLPIRLGEILTVDGPAVGSTGRQCRRFRRAQHTNREKDATPHARVGRDTVVHAFLALVSCFNVY